MLETSLFRFPFRTKKEPENKLNNEQKNYAAGKNLGPFKNKKTSSDGGNGVGYGRWADAWWESELAGVAGFLSLKIRNNFQVFKFL